MASICARLAELGKPTARFGTLDAGGGSGESAIAGESISHFPGDVDSASRGKGAERRNRAPQLGELGGTSCLSRTAAASSPTQPDGQGSISARKAGYPCLTFVAGPGPLGSTAAVGFY